MADNVGISTGTGATVAADDIGGVAYQRIKMVLGTDGTSLGDVDVTNPVPVAGTVSVSGAVQVSGTVSASAAVISFPNPTASGTLSALNEAVTFTLNGEANCAWQITGSFDATAVFEASNDNTNWVAIWGLQAGTTVIVQGTTVPGIFRNTVAGFKYVRVRCSIYASGDIGVIGYLSHGTSGVFINFPLPSGAAVIGTVAVSGPVNVTVATGTVSINNLVPVTTQASVSVSGVPVWMSPTQGVTILGTVSVSQTTVVSGLVSVTGVSLGVVVSGAVSISAMPAISGAVSISQIAPSLTIGTIVTVLGTLAVSQTTVVSGLVSVTGVSLGVVVSGAVSISAMPAISGAVSISAIAASQTIGTIVTVLGTQIVSVVPGLAVSISQIAASMTIGTIVTILGTQSVLLVNGLYTSTAVTTGTAQAVWLMNPTTVTVTVSQPFGDAIAFSFTTVSAPTVLTPALMDVAWLGTTVQTSMYVVPAGRRLAIQNVGCQVQNTAASVGFGRIEVYVRMSLSSSVTVGPVVVYMAAVALTSGTNGANAAQGDYGVYISTGYSVGFGYKASGGTGHLVGFVVQGVLF